MKPTEILMQEHRVIEQVLNCLEMICVRPELGVEDQRSIQDILYFLKNFADLCHHGKEENRLFPLLEAKGFSKDAGPTAVMRKDHVEGRNFIQEMSASLEAWKKGNANSLGSLKRAARGYIALLRDHIQKEDHCLWPMANACLTEEEQIQLEKDFHHVESHEMPADLHEKCLRIARSLAKQYGVSEIASKAAVGCCGGH